MKRLIVCALFAASSPLHAATAFLVSCQFGSSVTGQSIYVGVYNYGGQQFQRTFPASSGWCPQMVEVY